MDPHIVDKSIFKKFRDLGIFSFILTTCDFNYLINNIEYLISYEASESTLFIVCGVYSLPNEIDNMRILLNNIISERNLVKTKFFLFTSDMLAWVNSHQEDEAKYDYLINYIRCARYNLVRTIWQQLGLRKIESTIKDISTYVVDFDLIYKGGFDSVIRSNFQNKKIVLSWNSDQAVRKDFTRTLSGLNVMPLSKENNSLDIQFSHTYTTIKAGFSVFSPSQISNLYLILFANYSIGDEKMSLYMRAFTFYYSDQLSLFLALNDLKNSSNISIHKSMDWIDIFSSKIININDDIESLIYCPKGNQALDIN